MITPYNFARSKTIIENSNFYKRWWSGNNSSLLKKSDVYEAIQKCVLQDNEIAAEDFVRLMIMMMFRTIFNPDSSYSIRITFLETLEDFQNISKIAWGKVVWKLLDDNLKLFNPNNPFGLNTCSVALIYFFLEHTTLAKPRAEYKEHYPRFTKWKINEIKLSNIETATTFAAKKDIKVEREMEKILLDIPTASPTPLKVETQESQLQKLISENAMLLMKNKKKRDTFKILSGKFKVLKEMFRHYDGREEAPGMSDVELTESDEKVCGPQSGNQNKFKKTENEEEKFDEDQNTTDPQDGKVGENSLQLQVNKNKFVEQQQSTDDEDDKNDEDTTTSEEESNDDDDDHNNDDDEDNEDEDSEDDFEDDDDDEQEQSDTEDQDDEDEDKNDNKEKEEESEQSDEAAKADEDTSESTGKDSAPETTNRKQHYSCNKTNDDEPPSHIKRVKEREIRKKKIDPQYVYNTRRERPSSSKVEEDLVITDKDGNKIKQQGKPQLPKPLLKLASSPFQKNIKQKHRDLLEEFFSTSTNMTFAWSNGHVTVMGADIEAVMMDKFISDRFIDWFMHTATKNKKNRSNASWFPAATWGYLYRNFYDHYNRIVQEQIADVPTWTICSSL